VWLPRNVVDALVSGDRIGRLSTVTLLSISIACATARNRTLAGEDQHGKIGPRRLPANGGRKQLATVLDRLLRQKHGGRALVDLAHHRLEIGTDLAFDASVAQRGAGERRVLTRGRENE
jgi:hypothetical protein